MICSYCEREMTGGVSCIEVPVVLADGEHKAIPWGEEVPSWEGEDCHDCGVPKSGYHHPGCDVEQCPRCFWQLISCSCAHEPRDQSPPPSSGFGREEGE